ncbi:MAG: autoinducer binding domain-containing protein [Rhodobacter sp.]|nr:autoinducer binding domain-containing protein [Rhodobacter sp.]
MCPLGFAIALHIKYNAPTFLFQTFPEKWAAHYAKQGFVIRDPAVHWAFENTGFVRWRDLVESDTSGVMEQARLYGLTYGFTYSIHNDHSRTLAGFARSDRDYLDAEIDDIADRLEALDVLTAGIEILSAKDTEALQALSIRLTRST